MRQAWFSSHLRFGMAHPRESNNQLGKIEKPTIFSGEGVLVSVLRTVAPNAEFLSLSQWFNPRNPSLAAWVYKTQIILQLKEAVRRVPLHGHIYCLFYSRRAACDGCGKPAQRQN
jgi:hypothetical protein